MEDAKKELLDALEKVQQALPVAIKLINEGELTPIKVSQGASVEDTKITLSIPCEVTVTTAGVKSIEFNPYLFKLTIKFEKPNF